MASIEDLARRIPSGFVLGAATSAAQIEGGTREGGCGRSTWDAFCERPGRILDGSTTAVTADHFHRHAEDAALMRALGLDAYRFSFSWPRLQPGGIGPLNPVGVAFYDRLLDELAAAGVSAFATLSHWDIPAEYERGWLDRDTALRLGEFASLVGERFGDRIDAWMTINEPATVTLEGYALGLHAPGEAMLFDALPAAHHQLLGHGLAVQALRAASVRGDVGIVNVHTPVVPASDSAQDAAMAALFDLVHNRIVADPVLTGRYPDPPDGLEALLAPLATVTDADLTVIHQDLDFYGVNYYAPTCVAAGSGGPETPDGASAAMARLPFRLVPLAGRETTGFGWPVAPEYLAVALQEVRDRYGDALPPVYITENGASFEDAPGADGDVDDERRIAYLADHLGAALAAVSDGGAAEGVDLRGYFVWSLIDNWEWAAGFTQRFGLVHVDFGTGERTPKRSFHWLRELIASRDLQ